MVGVGGSGLTVESGSGSVVGVGVGGIAGGIEEWDGFVLVLGMEVLQE